jgi:hypothetical protein
MTEDEAKAMLAVLSDHYQEPVMPISIYCKALTTWRTAIRERSERMVASAYPGIDKPWGTPEKTAAQALFDHDAKNPKDHAGVQRAGDAHSSVKWYNEVSSTFTSIRKSNLLARLLYGAQEIRTTPCPIHKGVWSGCMWPDDPKDMCACMDGCNVTGWLPNVP